ncbi:hypothetical protein CGZ80_17905 [Rhodopirellula sp. MGV]|nr:hypothetical protein CGZ80_17905 [Rhodopirellula sp. MGV]
MPLQLCRWFGPYRSSRLYVDADAKLLSDFGRFRRRSLAHHLHRQSSRPQHKEFFCHDSACPIASTAIPGKDSEVATLHGDRFTKTKRHSDYSWLSLPAASLAELSAFTCDT